MIGIHVAKSLGGLCDYDKCVKGKDHTMLNAIKTVTQKAGTTAVQIFTHGPRNKHQSPMDYAAIGKYVDEQDIPLYVHTSYISISVWGITAENINEEKSQSKIKHLIDQMKSCEELGAIGLVLHLPKKTPDVIANVLDLIAPQLNKFDVYLLLEMPAMKADPEKTYETPEKLNRLARLIDKTKLENWGYCIDTAHLWCAGVDLSEGKVMKKWLKKIEDPNDIKLFHLNGCPTDRLGSGKDTHIIAFSDADGIWGGLDEKGKKKSGLAEVVKYSEKHDVPIICEINRGSQKDAMESLNDIKSLFKKWSEPQDFRKKIKYAK